MWPNPHRNADLFKFTEEIFNGKFHYFCSAENSGGRFGRWSVHVVNSVTKILMGDF